MSSTPITAADLRREIRWLEREISHYRADLVRITDPGQRQRVVAVVAELEQRLADKRRELATMEGRG